MAKLLLDEMFSGLKEYFELLGWDVLTVNDAGLNGARDKDIALYTKNNDLILVTRDQKLADMAEILQAKCILISSGLIAKVADEKIREKYCNRR